MTIYRKLVRDRIPEIIQRSGKIPIVRRLTADEYRAALRGKVAEEAQEVLKADEDALLVELADLTETIDAVLNAYGFTEADLKVCRASRNVERGVFSERIFLERVDE
jgi:predicted house-cleaning noncanonical NTP pyrophosphatase (MazG superfamily)